jgi:hypothetical protein
MSLKKISVVIFFFCVSIANGKQNGNGNGYIFSEQGMMSGTGLTFLPTVAITPNANFRVHFGRMQLTNERRGINVMTMSGGFSSHLEAYLKLSAEQQTQSPFSILSFGFGGKFRIPITLPFVEKIAVWYESSMSEDIRRSEMYPPNITRSGAIVSLDMNTFRIVSLFGACQYKNNVNPLLGGGIVIPVFPSLHLGIEYLRGYSQQSSQLVVANVATKIFSNVGFYINPGYIQLPSRTLWSIVAGFSLTSAEINFLPVTNGNGNGIKIPTIEELEKISQEENRK